MKTEKNSIKARIWTGKPTLATENGKVVKNFEQFEAWLQKQPEGQIEVWAGRWFAVAKEARPFTWRDGKCFCTHPSYQSQEGRDPSDFSGFFAYEAWKIAGRVSSFWGGIEGMAEDMVKAAAQE